MARVEGGYRSEGIRGEQCRPLFAWQSSYDSSVGIDGRCHPGICRAEQPAIVLDSTHASLIQMLGVSATVAIPSIVRQVHEQLRTLIGKLAHFAREYRLVTDKNSQPFTSRVERRARLAGFELSNFFG